MLLLGCEHHRAKLVDPDAPVHVVVQTAAGDASVTVEVADTKPVIQRGLMDRTELGPDRGMLFFMGKERDWGFWMHDTLIPLDIVFITRDLKIAGVVHDAVPKTEASLKVGAASLYVLEVNAGWTAAHHVDKGAAVRFDNIAL